MTDHTDELAGLPEDVREHVANMDANNTVNGSWNACRAELLRLTSEVAELSEHEDTLRFLYESAASEGDAARAELAALKRRLEDAEVVEVGEYGEEVWLDAHEYGNKNVALVVLDGGEA